MGTYKTSIQSVSVSSRSAPTAEASSSTRQVTSLLTRVPEFDSQLRHEVFWLSTISTDRQSLRHKTIERMVHLQDAAAGDAPLEVLHLRAGLVHVKGADDDHLRRRHKVPVGHRDLLDDVLAHGVDVVLELGGDGHDGRPLRDGALDEGRDGLVLVLGHALAAGATKSVTI